MHLTNCFFYDEWQDMGAIIPHCTYGQNALYECPCEGCNHFITAEDAREIVVSAVTKRDAYQNCDKKGR